MTRLISRHHPNPLVAQFERPRGRLLCSATFPKERPRASGERALASCMNSSSSNMTIPGVRAADVAVPDFGAAEVMAFGVRDGNKLAGSRTALGGSTTGRREINWGQAQTADVYLPETRACPQLEPERSLDAHGGRVAVWIERRSTVDGLRRLRCRPNRAIYRLSAGLRRFCRPIFSLRLSEALRTMDDGWCPSGVSWSAASLAGSAAATMSRNRHTGQTYDGHKQPPLPSTSTRSALQHAGPVSIALPPLLLPQYRTQQTAAQAVSNGRWKPMAGALDWTHVLLESLPVVETGATLLPCWRMPLRQSRPRIPPVSSRSHRNAHWPR